MKTVPERGTFTRLWSSRPARAASFVAVFLLFCGALVFYAQSNGGITNPLSGKASITWLNANNAQKELGLSQDAQGNVKVATTTPVLLVMCTSEMCENEALGLREAIKQFDGKVKIVAVDPYKEKLVADFVAQQLVYPAVVREMAMRAAYQYALQYSQEKKVPLNEQLVQQIMQDPSFQQYIQGQLAQMPLLQPVYPKFFLLQAKTFSLLSAQIGIESKDVLIEFIEGTLKSVEDAKNQPAPAQTTPSTAPATTPASPSATPAPATTDGGKSDTAPDKP